MHAYSLPFPFYNINSSNLALLLLEMLCNYFFLFLLLLLQGKCRLLYPFLHNIGQTGKYPTFIVYQWCDWGQSRTIIRIQLPSWKQQSKSLISMLSLSLSLSLFLSLFLPPACWWGRVSNGAVQQWIRLSHIWDLPLLPGNEGAGNEGCQC